MEHNQEDGHLITLANDDIFESKTKNIITLEKYIKSIIDNSIEDYSNWYLLIYCIMSSVSAYRVYNVQLYPDEKSINDINTLILNFKGKRIFHIHDIHDYTFIDGYFGFKNYCKNNNINLVIGNYIYNNESKIINSILKDLEIPYYVIPNLINDNIFKNYNNDKIYDILIYGNMGFCYILRKRMLDIIKKTTKWKSRIIEFNELTGIELSEEINKSYLSVATCSTFEYFLCKYIEIPMSSSLVIGNLPEQGKMLFGNDDFIQINDNMTDIEIIDKIDKVLENKTIILDKIKIMSNKLEFFKLKYKNIYLNKCIYHYEEQKKH